ncbi:hypothetical protein BG011_007538 [Mortierella polycephala]|uniref:GH16 domain-containing protein n=1 Tax=Mortierella polycephala TaxID=41804 RepID=A0A9P6PT50_9FUNG|nr:hypothetical protein BG011_007538 [Mortierella polycephala]
MKNIPLSLPLFLLLNLSLALWTLETQLVEGSFFGRNNHDHHSNSVTTRESSYCGSRHMPCPAAEPCCNNGTCHTTSMEACPISLGCNPTHSHPEGCFPLPACRNIKDNFKQADLLIPKYEFTGDPNQAHWFSNYHHIAPYAKIDHHQNKLLLRTRRDMVKTHSGGGFGATISSTRWNKYGTFSAKLKSGSTGPGIVTAFLLSNPALGEEISFELTGKNPKKVVTNYYRRVQHPAEDDLARDRHTHHDDMSHPSHEHPYGRPYSRLESHEETFDLKKDSTKHEMVYKIEWNEKMIRWSVDGKVLRTVYAKDAVTASKGGLPENAMQVQLTIWDAGHNPETMEWAGGKTEYGADNLDEYVAIVDSIEIACKDPKEGNKPWPGPEAMKRLKRAQKEQEKLSRRMSRGGSEGRGFMAKLVDMCNTALLSLIKWTFVVLSIVCGAAYLTEPTGKKATVESASLHRRNLAAYPS